jgi:hypothetical protein
MKKGERVRMASEDVVLLDSAAWCGIYRPRKALTESVTKFYERVRQETICEISLIVANGINLTESLESSPAQGA